MFRVDEIFGDFSRPFCYPDMTLRDMLDEVRAMRGSIPAGSVVHVDISVEGGEKPNQHHSCNGDCQHSENCGNARNYEEMRRRLNDESLDRIDAMIDRLTNIVGGIGEAAEKVSLMTRMAKSGKPEYKVLSLSAQDLPNCAKSIVYDLAEFLEGDSCVTEVVYRIVWNELESSTHHAFVIWNDDNGLSVEDMIMNLPLEEVLPRTSSDDCGKIEIISSENLEMYDAFDLDVAVAESLLRYSVLKDDWDDRGLLVLHGKITEDEDKELKFGSENTIISIAGIKDVIADCHKEYENAIQSGKRRFGRSEGGVSDEEKTSE